MGTRQAVAWLVLIVGCRADSTLVATLGSSSSSGGPSTPSEDGDTSTSTGEPVPEFCAGAVAIRYAPGSGTLDAFPDDVLTTDTEAGTRVRIRDLLGELGDDEPLAGFPSLFEGLATLDGFGTTAPMFLRFAGAIDPASLPAAGTETDPATSTLLLVDLDARRPTFVAFDWTLVAEAGPSDDTTLVVAPLGTLRAGTRYALALRRDARSIAGDCIAPSPAMRDLLAGEATDPALVRIADRYADLLAVLGDTGAIAEPTDLSAAIVFTTQTNLAESTTIANAIAGANPPPIDEGACVAEWSSPYRVCEHVLTMADFTGPDGVVVAGAAPQSFYGVPVTTFLPTTGAGPFPAVIYGHGLTGDRTTAAWLAWIMAPHGYAVVAIDAPKHGAHPDAAVINSAVDLLGLSGDMDDPFLALDARDNFRQATFDKLQLLRRIEVGMDLDADGIAELDGTRVYYVGASLGAVMAPQFLAYAPQVRAASLVVGGARLTDIVAGEEFSALVALVTEQLSPDERTRLLALAQAALDRGEPEVYAGHVLAHRIAGFDSRRPHVLAQLAVGDTIVPNTSTGYLVRALGIPIVGPQPVELRGVERQQYLPLFGNLGSSRTGGLYEFAEVDGQPASHGNVQGDAAAQLQTRAFLESADDPRGATIIDPLTGR